MAETQEIKQDGKDKKSIGERAIFWIGSIAGIVLSLIALYEKFIEPSNAKIKINFLESNSKNLYIYPSVNTASAKTEAIPMQVKIENTGGKVAGNIKLYVSYFSSIELETKYKKETKRTLNNPNEPMSQVSLDLESLNPGESFLIPIEVKLDFPIDFQKTLRTPEPLHKDSIPNLLAFTLNCDISCETTNSVRSKLQIFLGRLDFLQKESRNVFFIGHSSDGVELVQVTDGFPKN